jgi:hypothetical protein
MTDEYEYLSEEEVAWANDTAEQIDQLEKYLGRTLYRREEAALFDGATKAAETGREFDPWVAFHDANAGFEEYDLTTPEGRARSMAERMQDSQVVEAEAREEEGQEAFVASLADASEEEPEE